jgi:tetratricopeptide (TPR) repeat protein
LFYFYVSFGQYVNNKPLSKLLYAFYLLVSMSMLMSCSQPRADQTPAVQLHRDRVAQLLNEQKFAEAAAACDTIISIDSRDAWAYERKAMALFQLGRYEEMKTLLDVYIGINNSSWEGYFWRGQAKKILGDTMGAIKDYSWSIEINSDNPLALNNRGNLYGRLNKIDSAIMDFKAALKADSAFVQGWNNLSLFYLRMGYTDSADAAFAQGLKYDKSGLLYQQRGLERYNAKQFEMAVADLTLSLLYDSKNALTYLYRAYAYAELGDHNAACEDLSKARDLGNAEAGRYYGANCQKM